MTWRQQRESTRIHHPQTCDANNSSLAVHNCIRVIEPTHLTGAASVPDRHECIADGIEDLRITLYVGAREVLPSVSKTALHGICGKGLADTLVNRNGDGLISRISQPSWVDVGKLVDAGTVQSNGAAGQRSNDGA